MERFYLYEDSEFHIKRMLKRLSPAISQLPWLYQRYGTPIRGEALPCGIEVSYVALRPEELPDGSLEIVRVRHTPLVESNPFRVRVESKRTGCVDKFFTDEDEAFGFATDEILKHITIKGPDS